MEFTKNFNPSSEDGEIMSLETLFKDNTPEQEDITPLITPAEDEELEEIVIEPIVQEPINNEDPKPTPTSIYKEYVIKKITSGEWADVEGLDELEVDEDVFDEIQKAQIDHKVREAKENTIKTDNLSPIMLKALEIDKNGGNISQVFETYKNIYENPAAPIANLDLDSPADQEKILRYLHKSTGLEDFEVESIIDGHKKNLTLAPAAGKAKEKIDAVFTKYLDDQAQQAEAAKTQQKEAIKAYRNSISEEAKKYQINDSYRKSIIEKLSKQDENGRYAADALYDEWRRDPEKAVRIAMFMTNEDEYIKTRAEKVIMAEKQDNFIKLKLSGANKSQGTVDYNSSKHKEKDVVSLSEL